MDQDMTMEDERETNKENIAIAIKKDDNLSKNIRIKKSKKELFKLMRERMKNKVDEIRKERNKAEKNYTIEKTKNSNTVDLTWFKTNLNDINKNNNNITNFKRLSLLRIQFTHKLARNDNNGKLIQNYYNDNTNKKSIYDWNDMDHLLLIKGIKKYGFYNYNAWRQISQNLLPNRTTADIKIRITQLFGIQNLTKKYSNMNINNDNINELFITNEFNKNKEIGIKNNLWINNIYFNDLKPNDLNNILSQNNLETKLNNYNKAVKGKIEFRDNEFQDKDGNVYYFKISQILSKKDFYGYNNINNINDIDEFDFNTSDDDEISDNEYKNKLYNDIMYFNESDYDIIDKQCDSKENSIDVDL